MTKLEQKLKDVLRSLQLPFDSSVLIGVSGGADSMALLDAMKRWQAQCDWRGTIYAAHVNHLLRGAEADEDEQFVRSYAESLSTPIVVTQINVAAQALATGQNLEATARQLRYDFFRGLARQHKVSLVFTAHTYDDQVETILMRWLRGTGAAGLRGIHEESELCAGVRLVRPLLAVTRTEVLEHCAHYGVTYRTDSSNLSETYTRNRVRHTLLPLLRSFNPQFGAALLRGTAHWQTDAECLDEQASAWLQRVSGGEKLRARELAAAHRAIRLRVLQAWVRQGRADLRQISASHWQALDRLVTHSQSGRTIELPHGWRVTREFDQLRLWEIGDVILHRVEPVPLVADKPQQFGKFEFRLIPMTSASATSQDQALADDPVHSAHLCLEAVSQNLYLRARLPGDAYVPGNKISPIKLKTLLIRHKIAVSQRDSHPLLVTAGGDIIWSPGLPVARTFVANPTQASYVLVIARERCNLPNATGVMPVATGT